MNTPVHLVIVEEDKDLILKFAEICAILGYRCTFVPFKIIQHGRVGGYLTTLAHVNAVIVASYFAQSRMSKGEEVVAAIRAHCPDLPIIGCGGDDSHKDAMRKAGAKVFAIRGMRTGMQPLFESIKKLLENATPEMPRAKSTPDQK